MKKITDLDEKDLILRLKKGDMQAFDDLYWKYQKAIYQNAFKLTQNKSASEDIVQEIFISLWEKRNIIDADRSVGGWLFVLSYNRSVNVLKKVLRESKVFNELGIPDSEPDESIEISQKRLRILENGIANLSPQQKRVVELCKLEGMTYEEAAEEMKISKHTVKEYLSLGMASLRDFAKEYAGTTLFLLFASDFFLSV